MWTREGEIRRHAPPAHRREEPDGRHLRQHPGREGIGEKSAFTLIQKYGSLEGVYAHLDDTTDKTIKPKQREHLAEDRAMAELSYTLGTIRTDAPIDTAEAPMPWARATRLKPSG